MIRRYLPRLIAADAAFAATLMAFSPLALPRLPYAFHAYACFDSAIAYAPLPPYDAATLRYMLLIRHAAALICRMICCRFCRRCHTWHGRHRGIC